MYDQYGNYSPSHAFLGSLGTGLSQILGGYVGQKLEQDRIKRQYETNEKILRSRFPDMDPQQIAEAAQVPTQNIKDVISGLESRNYQTLMSGGQPGMQQPQQPLQPDLALQRPFFAEPPSPEAQMMQQPQMMPEAIAQQQMAQQVAPGQELTTGDIAQSLTSDINRLQTGLTTLPLNSKQTKEVNDLINSKKEQLTKLVINRENEAAAERRFQKKNEQFDKKFELDKEKLLKNFNFKEREFLQRRQDRIEDKFNPVLKQIRDKAEAKLIDNSRFAEMKRINEEGDLGSNGFNVLVDALGEGLFGLGVNLSMFQTADAQAMKKLSKDFVKNVKETIGTSRITQQEIQLYLSTIPNLMQSPEGRARIIETNMLLNQIDIDKANIANKIIKDNNGLIPKDIETQIEEKLRPKINRLTKEMTNVAKRVKQNEKLQKKQKEFKESSLTREVFQGAKKRGQELLGLAGEAVNPLVDRFQRDFSSIPQALGQDLRSILDFGSRNVDNLEDILGPRIDYTIPFRQRQR